MNMTKQFIFSTSFVLLAHLAFSQGAAFDYADDAYRYSDFSQNGTARFGVLAATMLPWVEMPVTCPEIRRVWPFTTARS